MNQFYPASARIPRVGHPLLLNRVVKTDCLIVGDCKSAFYRIRLKDPVWVHAGGKDYLCHRMAFGLSMGPEGLRNTLGVLWEHWRTRLAVGGFASLFVDDFFISGTPGQVDTNLKRLLHLLGVCGFEVPQNKFQDNTPTINLLGVQLTRDEGSVSVKCDQRTQAIHDSIEKLSNRISKREVFALAGLLGYDAIAGHAEKRLVADVIRSLTGRYNTKRSWNDVIELCSQDHMIFQDLLAWTKDCMNQTCEHVTRPSQNKILLRLETDASKFGLGFVLKHRGSDADGWSVVAEAAGKWKPAQMNHHVNRQEGYSLLVGIRTTVFFLEFLENARCGDSSALDIRVEVMTDSTTAISWAQRGAIDCQIDYKSVELRQILMLAEALHMEIAELRKRVSSVTLRHVEGKENEEADRLSRLLYRSIGGKPLGGLLRKETKEVDRVSLVKQTPIEPLVETLARDSASLDQLLYRLTCLVGHTRLGGRINEEQPDPWETRTLRYLARVSQRGWKPKAAYVEEDGIYYNEHTQIDGSLVRRLVIPEHVENVSRLIARHYHSANAHRGARFDMAALFSTPFFLERASSVISRMVAACLICARKNASSRKSAISAVQTVERDVSLPPFSRVSIDFLHIRTTTVLSVLCRDTGVVFLTRVSRPSAAGAMEGLRRVNHIYCVSPRHVHSDNAQALSKQFRSIATSEWPGVEFTTTAPYASHQNPVERAHREVWSILRARRFAKAVLEDVENVTNEDLEEIAWIINRRPLGVYRDGAMITPAGLAWGASHSGTGSKLAEVRRYFYENIFLLLRRRHLPSRRSRRATVSIGEIVLFQAGPEKGKHEFVHDVGRIIAIEGNSAIVKNSKNVFRVASNFIVPLILEEDRASE